MDRKRGSIQKRGDKKYLVRVFVGNRPDGSRIYSSEIVNGSVSAAKLRLTQMSSEADRGITTAPTNMTVAEHVAAFFLSKVDISECTAQGYSDAWERYLAPSLGHLKLSKLGTDHIQKVYAEMLAADYAPRTIRIANTVLKQAMKSAVEKGFLFRNPCDLVKLPKRSHTEMQVLTPEQTGVLLASAESVKDNEQRTAIWALALYGGLRPQELMALKWDDLDGNTVRIKRAVVQLKGRGQFAIAECKTEKSRRAVVLSERALRCLAVHRVSQARSILKLGQGYSRRGFIFSTSTGNHLDISNLRRWWYSALKTAGLPKIRLYDTRHTNATLLLGAGVHPKIVSERLGHSTVTLTMDTYSHVLPTMQEAAAVHLEGVLNKAASSNGIR